MKKLIAAAVAALSLAAAGTASAENLTVAATAVPHAEILNLIKPTLAKEGVDLKIKVFTDYVQPNVQVAEKRLDANFFQHQPYLDEFNKGKGTNLVAVAGVHVEPFGAYSTKYKTLAELPEGATVAIPNDATNGGRALLLLDKAGVIKLKDKTNILATPKDIAENPKNLKFRELEAATLPRVLAQVDLALINTNYALEAKLNPAKDALVIEGRDSPYVNYLVARPDNKDSPGREEAGRGADQPRDGEALHPEEVQGRGGPGLLRTATARADLGPAVLAVREYGCAPQTRPRTARDAVDCGVVAISAPHLRGACIWAGVTAHLCRTRTSASWHHGGLLPCQGWAPARARDSLPPCPNSPRSCRSSSFSATVPRRCCSPASTTGRWWCCRWWWRR